MANTADLLRLPPELMLRISTHLTTHELACFRLTCKQIETNLFESFAREFFTKRQFMLEEVSLDALVGIANHKTLAPYLKEVIISNDKLPDVRSNPRSDCSEPDAFMATGHAHIMLADAFSKLPSLRTIGIRDYDGKGRWRDGDGGTATWRSYGWSSASNPSGRPYRPRMNTESILPLLIYSLDKTPTGVEHIEVFLRRNRLPDASFDLSPSYMQAKAVPVLSNLKTLLLSLQSSQIARYPSMFIVGGPAEENDSLFRNLRKFLGHTPLLEHLRLNFDGLERPSLHAAGLLAWLGASPGATDTPAPINLDRLTTLDLGMVHIVPRTLLDIVSKFARLQALSLWKVTLQRTQGDPNDADHDGNCLCSYYLRKLGNAFQAPEDVKTLMVGWLSESGGSDTMPAQVRFAGTTKVDSNGTKTYEDVEDVVKYRKKVGSNAREWLEELGEKAFLLTFDGDSSDNSDGDEDDEEGQGDDSESDGSLPDGFEDGDDEAGIADDL